MATISRRSQGPYRTPDVQLDDLFSLGETARILRVPVAELRVICLMRSMRSRAHIDPRELRSRIAGMKHARAARPDMAGQRLAQEDTILDIPQEFLQSGKWARKGSWPREYR